MNDIKTVLIVLQFVVIAVLTYLVTGGQGNEAANYAKYSENARSRHKTFGPTPCEVAYRYSDNYKDYMTRCSLPGQLNKEGATFKIDKGNLLAVINASPLSNYIVGVIGRNDTSNTMIMVPVDTNGMRVNMSFPGTGAGTDVDEMYPIIGYLSDPHCYDFFRCP